MRGRVLLSIVILGLIGAAPAPLRAQGANGSGMIAFRATVGGSVRDTGTISTRQGMVTDLTGGTDFNGCALVKNKDTEAPFGAYRFNIHVNYMSGINLMLDGIRPHVQQEIELEVYNYRANVSTYNATLSLAFVMGGRLYFTGTHTTVTMRNGGLDGTIRSVDVLRSYPTRVSDLTLQATWHCSTLFHVARSV
jgi:hypothetical protein